MKKRLLIYIFILVTSFAQAQLFELGVFAGGSNYIGDIGSTKYIWPNSIAAGGIAKFNWTPRINFRGTLIWTDLGAKDQNADTQFRQNRGYTFKNRILEASAGIEFNFFKYNLAKIGYTQTPYIILQAGLVNYRVVSEQTSPTTVGTKRITSLVLPFGVGYKMQLGHNLGIAFETTVRYTFKDDIDGNNHDIDLPRYNFGDPSTNDWYVFTGITVVYAFGRPGCYKDNFF